MKQIMVGRPKTAKSGPGMEDSASDPPNSNDLQDSADRTFHDRIGSFDARVQSALLHEAFVEPEPLTPGSDSPLPSPAHQPSAPYSRWASRALKSAVGLAIVAVVGVGPMQRLSNSQALTRSSTLGSFRSAPPLTENWRSICPLRR
jgi:hypothetical protein